MKKHRPKAGTIAARRSKRLNTEAKRRARAQVKEAAEKAADRGRRVGLRRRPVIGEFLFYSYK